jgi:hypothetical protein
MMNVCPLSQLLLREVQAHAMETNPLPHKAAVLRSGRHGAVPNQEHEKSSTQHNVFLFQNVLATDLGLSLSTVELG